MLPILQQEFDELEQLRHTFWAIIASSNAEQRHFKPKPDAWCMLQVAQHVIASENGALRFINKHAARKNSFWGNLQSRIIAGSLKMLLHLPFKFKAPNIAELSPQHTEAYEIVGDNWLKVRESWRAYLEKVQAAQLNDIVFKHPVAGNMTLQQTLNNFMLAHLKHHLIQLKRIKTAPNFPA